MTAIWSLIGGFKGAVIIAVIIALGSWAVTQKISLNRAVAARDTAIAERDQAGIARDKAIQAAKDNEATIARLEEEKVNLNQALNNLETAREEIKVNTAGRNEAIQSTANVPANAAVTAPVLGNLIDEIQADRARRRGIAPGVKK